MKKKKIANVAGNIFILHRKNLKVKVTRFKKNIQFAIECLMLSFNSPMLRCDHQFPFCTQFCKARSDPDVNVRFLSNGGETELCVRYEAIYRVVENHKLFSKAECKRQLTHLVRTPDEEMLASMFPSLYFSICHWWGRENVLQVLRQVGCLWDKQWMVKDGKWMMNYGRVE